MQSVSGPAGTIVFYSLARIERRPWVRPGALKSFAPNSYYSSGAFASAAAKVSGQAFRVGGRSPSPPSAAIGAQPDPSCWSRVGPGGRCRGGPRHCSEENETSGRGSEEPRGCEPVQQHGRETEQESKQVAKSRSRDRASDRDRPPHHVLAQQDRLPRQPLRVVDLVPRERGALRPLPHHQPQPWHLLVHLPRWRHGAVCLRGTRADHLQRLGTIVPDDGCHRTPVLQLGELSRELVLFGQRTQA